ncbi:MAG: VCBS repeat-containing protein [Planctomycetota bacterium]
MRLHVKSVCGGIVLGVSVLALGCTELFFAFGPGGIWGPEQSSLATTGGDTPTVIAAPAYVSDQIDPLLEATAGAKVIVQAQLTDDNGDGLINNADDMDLVSGHDENQPIQIHIKQADGKFLTLSIAGGGPIARMRDLAIADFDSDGRNDIAVLVNDTGFVPQPGADLRGAVVLLFNPPTPTNALSWVEVNLVQPFILPSDATGMTSFAVADFNGDGRTDIVLGTNEIDDVLGETQKNVRLYLNPGGAAARGEALWTETTDPLEEEAVAVEALGAADIDGDGDMDIVASFPVAKTFSIHWLVNPRIPAGVAVCEAGVWARKMIGQQGEVDPDNQGGDFVALGDIDGDGDTDVAAAHAGLRLVQWFRNPAQPAAAGGWNIVKQQTFPWEVFNLTRLQEGFTITQLQLVRLNGDAQLDGFLTANGSMVGMEVGDDIENFWDAFTITTTDPVAEIGKCQIMDVNGDGLFDIVAPLNRSGLTQDQILVYLRLTP